MVLVREGRFAGEMFGCFTGPLDAQGGGANPLVTVSAGTSANFNGDRSFSLTMKKPRLFRDGAFRC